MIRERITSEDTITVKVGDLAVAEFEDGGNGMSGHISEGNLPIAEGGAPIRLDSADLIAVASWLLTKAEERTRSEADTAYNEGVRARLSASGASKVSDNAVPTKGK